MLKTLSLVLLLAGSQINAVIDINGKGINKQALFFGACSKGYIELVKTLLNAGVDVNAKNNGNTALGLAVMYRQMEAIELLIAAGADTEITNAQGKTAFDIALEMLNIQIIGIFQNYYKEQEAKQLAQANAIGKSVVTIANSSDNNLNILQNTEVPAHSKAVITTEISKI